MPTSPSAASASANNNSHHPMPNDLLRCSSNVNVLSPTYGISARDRRSLSIPDVVPVTATSGATAGLGVGETPFTATTRARSVSQVTIVRAPATANAPGIKVTSAPWTDTATYFKTFFSLNCRYL